MKEILLVEDNVPTSLTIKKFLERFDYQVLHRENGLDALELVKQRTYQLDLIILDVLLPGLNGLDLLKKIRAQELDMPVLMLTTLGDTQNIVKALNLGADDYLVKPFAIAELQARLKSLLRRPKKIKVSQKGVGEFRIDSNQRKIFYKNNDLKLTRKEYEILKFFLTYPNQTLSRDYILLNVWNMETMPTQNSIDVHVRRIRSKIGDLNSDILQTIHGFGYKFHVKI